MNWKAFGASLLYWLDTSECKRLTWTKISYIFFISTYEILELLPLFSFWMLWDQVTVVVLQSHLGLCGLIPGVATEMRSFHIARRGCRSGPLASTYCRRWCCYASLRWAQNTWNSKNKTLVYIYNKLTRIMIHGVRSRNEQWTNIQGVSYWYISFKLTLTDRNMQVRFCSKVVLECWV